MRRRPGRFVVTRLDQPPLASAKAPADVRAVCVSHGLTAIDLYDFDRSTVARRLWGSIRSAMQLIVAATRLASAGDVVVQYPLGRINERILATMRLGSRSVCVVHDLEMLRRPDIAYREEATLRQFDVVIAHSEAMAATLRVKEPDRSVVVLEAFDFLGSRPELPAAARPTCLYVFGNLSREKAGYLYQLHAQQAGPPVEAYGPNCDAELLPPGVHWNGLLDPDEPGLGQIRGFGLVWDGDSPSALAGPVGEYLRYNAPHKFSLYLALGIPVIVPRGAAISAVVERYGLGLCVSTVEEGLHVIESCDESTWSEMVRSAQEGRRRVRSGEFMHSALLRAGVADQDVEGFVEGDEYCPSGSRSPVRAVAASPGDRTAGTVKG